MFQSVPCHQVAHVAQWLELPCNTYGIDSAPEARQALHLSEVDKLLPELSERIAPLTCSVTIVIDKPPQIIKLSRMHSIASKNGYRVHGVFLTGLTNSERLIVLSFL